MNKSLRIVSFFFAASLAAVPGAFSQTLSVPTPEAEPLIVEKIEIRGNRFLQVETLLFYVSTKPGDRFDVLRLRDDFRRLWDTGFLRNLFVDVADGPSGGVVVTFGVEERRRIQIVDFRGSKKVKNDDINEKLKELDLQLRIDTFYDLGKARRIEEVIKQMLREKGHPFATVVHDAKNLGPAGSQVTFEIEDGPNAQVKEISFAGNEVFSDGELRGNMKEIKQKGFWNLTWLNGKTKYTEDKWSEDQENIRNAYLKKGFVEAKVGTPKVTYSDGKSGIFKKKPIKWMTLEIPVEEGEQYRVGEIEFEGLTVFKEESIRPYFKLRTGEVYNDEKLNKAYEKLRDVYGAWGYFQWTGYTERNPDPERKVVDLVIHMEEDKQYFVGKINFTGNDTTRDKVVRREVYLNEGDIFNTELLKQSIRRVNQLGYFKPMEGVPRLTPSRGQDDKLDVTFQVEEQNRNQFTFGGGVSGLEGTFVNASFSTTNFLGHGETFQISAQTGRRTKNYQFAITEPYFMDRPITAGIDIFRRRIEFLTNVGQGLQGYVDDRKGFRLISGMPVTRWSRLFATYAYEIVNIELTDLEETDPFLPTTPAISSAFLQDEGRRAESRISPSISLNTTDNPFQPRSGKKYTATLPIAGGVLGGDLNYLRPTVELVHYIPHTSRTALGVRAEVAWLRPYGDTGVVDPETGRSLLPFYLRFFLGGENQLRGYVLRSVGPRNPVSGQLIGGTKYYLFNAEYYIDIIGPLRFLFFFDAGQTFLEGDNMNLKEAFISTGAEVRFIMPVVNVPFRLIYAFNPKQDGLHPEKTFKFAVGTTF